MTEINKHTTTNKASERKSNSREKQVIYSNMKNFEIGIGVNETNKPKTYTEKYTLLNKEESKN